MHWPFRVTPESFLAIRPFLVICGCFHPCLDLWDLQPTERLYLPTGRSR
jgi:hypothetical protein